MLFGNNGIANCSNVFLRVAKANRGFQGRPYLSHSTRSQSSSRQYELIVLRLEVGALSQTSSIQRRRLKLGWRSRRNRRSISA